MTENIDSDYFLATLHAATTGPGAEIMGTAGTVGTRAKPFSAGK